MFILTLDHSVTVWQCDISLYLGWSILAGRGSVEAEVALEKEEVEPDLEPVEVLGGLQGVLRALVAVSVVRTGNLQWGVGR